MMNLPFSDNIIVLEILYQYKKRADCTVCLLTDLQFNRPAEDIQKTDVSSNIIQRRQTFRRQMFSLTEGREERRSEVRCAV